MLRQGDAGCLRIYSLAQSVRAGNHDHDNFSPCAAIDSVYVRVVAADGVKGEEFDVRQV